MMKNLEWRNLYSHTDEPDKMNRWARLLYCNNLLIGWVNRIEHDGKVVFQAHSYFPIIENSHSSFYSAKWDTFEESKNSIETLWVEFKEKIK